jgi:hypothetical protein
MEELDEIGLSSVHNNPLPIRRQQFARRDARDQPNDGGSLGAPHAPGSQIVPDGLTRHSYGLRHLALPGRPKKGFADLRYFRCCQRAVIGHVRRKTSGRSFSSAARFGHFGEVDLNAVVSTLVCELPRPMARAYHQRDGNRHNRVSEALTSIKATPAAPVNLR